MRYYYQVSVSQRYLSWVALIRLTVHHNEEGCFRGYRHAQELAFCDFHAPDGEEVAKIIGSLYWRFDVYPPTFIMGVQPVQAIGKYSDAGRNLYLPALLVEFERGVPMVGQLFTLHATDTVDLRSLSTNG